MCSSERSPKDRQLPSGPNADEDRPKPNVIYATVNEQRRPSKPTVNGPQPKEDGEKKDAPIYAEIVGDPASTPNDTQGSDGVMYANQPIIYSELQNADDPYATIDNVW